MHSKLCLVSLDEIKEQFCAHGRQLRTAFPCPSTATSEPYRLCLVCSRIPCPVVWKAGGKRETANRTCRFPASGFPTGFIAEHTAAGQDARVVAAARREARRPDGPQSFGYRVLMRSVFRHRRALAARARDEHSQDGVTTSTAVCRSAFSLKKAFSKAKSCSVAIP